MATETVSPAETSTDNPQPPRELLRQLDGWLSSSGHDERHPWRHSIAQSLAAHPQQPPRQVLHEPFQWGYAATANQSRVDPALGRAATFAATARDISAGVRSVLAIIEQDAIDAGMDADDGQPAPAILPPQVAGDLQRLAIVALDMLAAKAEEHGEWVAARAVNRDRLA